MEEAPVTIIKAGNPVIKKYVDLLQEWIIYVNRETPVRYTWTNFQVDKQQSNFLILPYQLSDISLGVEASGKGITFGFFFS